MFTVGCAGFGVPATRYFKEHRYVEVQETRSAPPGPGTLRRWQREGPPGFEFALMAPREIGDEGFRLGRVVETALANLEEVAVVLAATTVIFSAPQEFGPTRANKAALREFLLTARKGRYARLVFELGSLWSPQDADLIAAETDTLASRDPLQHGLSKLPRAYYRLPGQAGFKSRYEDPALAKLAALAAEAKHEEATYVFANVDMFLDAKRFKKLVGVA